MEKGIISLCSLETKGDSERNQIFTLSSPRSPLLLLNKKETLQSGLPVWVDNTVFDRPMVWFSIQQLHVCVHVSLWAFPLWRPRIHANSLASRLVTSSWWGNWDCLRPTCSQTRKDKKSYLKSPFYFLSLPVWLFAVACSWLLWRPAVMAAQWRASITPKQDPAGIMC